MAFYVEGNPGDQSPGIFIVCSRRIYGYSGLLADFSRNFRRRDAEKRRSRGKRVYPKLEVREWQQISALKLE